jgi:hypothetical protein
MLTYADAALQAPPAGTPAVAGLNPSQIRAISGAVTRRLTLVQVC